MSNQHTIVIGGSMTGLCAARVLADHFDQVTLIERDRIAGAAGPRNGVPQARHAHILLTRGEREIERLFPGIVGELTQLGACELDWSRDCAFIGPAGTSVRFDSGVTTHACSRDLLEHTVRSRLASHNTKAGHAIAWLTGAEVTGVTHDAAKRRVTGVTLRSRNTTASDIAENLPADLIVDASGRNSHAAEWLTQLGYPAPADTIVNSFLGYASRWFNIPAQHQADWKCLLVNNRPPDNPRSGVIYPIEGNRWIVTLGGISRCYPPTDPEGFLAFARDLLDPRLYAAIKDAEPISPVYGYQRTENRLRRYEQLDRMPEGLVAIGDAVCAFNPVYGQGMTVGALGALTLDAALRQERLAPGFPLRFQKQLAHASQTAWLLATGADFRWEATEGVASSRRSDRLAQRYIDRVMRASVRDPVASMAVLEVTHLLKPATAFFRPSVMLAAARQARRERRVDAPIARASGTMR